MITSARGARSATPAYPDGRVYTPARGRYAPRTRVEDQLALATPVVQGYPSAAEFLRVIIREMRIRFYQRSTVKKYRNAIRSFLNWYGGPPHRVIREDVREYLLYLVDAGLGSSTVSTHLFAIRIAFDKMCHRQVTLGTAQK